MLEKLRDLEDEDYENLINICTKLSVVQVIIIAVLVVFLVVLKAYTVTTVYVEGNEHYTAAEIRRLVENSWFGDNSLILSAKYSGSGKTNNIPFVESMDVDVIDRHTIKVTVYEKRLAGFVQYLGKNIYFDKDGIVVESSDEKTLGIPLVTGLSFDHFVMYEQLPVEDVSVFQTVLNVTQLLQKYNISTDRIFFNEGTMVLYFGKVRVGLGSNNLLEEKIQRLDAILPQLDGLDGYLDMSSYDEGNESFTFTKS